MEGHWGTIPVATHFELIVPGCVDPGGHPLEGLVADVRWMRVDGDVDAETLGGGLQVVSDVVAGCGIFVRNGVVEACTTCGQQVDPCGISAWFSVRWTLAKRLDVLVLRRNADRMSPFSHLPSVT